MGDETPADPLRLGVIRASGPDAAEFLRAQLTNDVFRLGPDRHFIAAWCDAKGRALLVVRLLATPGAYLLLLPHTLVESSLRKLRMYVLRLRVELTDVSTTYGIWGMHEAADAPDVNQTVTTDDQIRLGLPGSAEHARRTLVLQRGAAPPAGTLPVDSIAWRLSEIDAGIPQVTTATQGLFVPQMLNLHWLMAIDFDKGCYPGQEVIARLHYRGRLTRRIFRLGWQQGRCPRPGEAVREENGDPVGQVLQAAGDGDGRALAVVQVNAAARDNLQAESTGRLRRLELPYATPD